MQALPSGKVAEKFLAVLRSEHGENFFLLGVMGIRFGLRISDLLSIKFGDFAPNKELLRVYERKTRKMRVQQIDADVRQLVLAYQRTVGAIGTDYIFTGRHERRPMSRTTAWRHLKAAGAILGLGKVGTHGLRKTFAVEALRASGGNIEAVARMMNHSSGDITLKYYILPSLDIQAAVQKLIAGY
jgi:integrase